MSRTLPFKLLLSALLLLPAIGLEAQKPDPVAWETSVESMGEDVYLLRIEARIEAPWHIYDMGPYEGGPNPTTISFESNPDAELIGGIAEPAPPRRVRDELFGMEIGTYASKAVFTQRVRLKKAGDITLKATVEWMACDEGSCLPPEERTLTFTIRGASAGQTAGGTGATGTERPAQAETKPAPDIRQTTEARGRANEAADGQSPLSQTKISFGDKPSPETDSPTESRTDEAAAAAAAAEPDGQESTFRSAAVSAARETGEGSLWAAIVEAMLWGLAALLTPCVFPMIPMTVSFFMKGSENRTRGRFESAGLRTLHRRTLHVAYHDHHRHHQPLRTGNRHGRHFQLAGHALDSERDLLPSLHGFRRLLFRSVRDHDAEPFGEPKRRTGGPGRPDRYLFHGADARAGLVLVHGPDRGFRTDQVDFGRDMGSRFHDAGLLGRVRAALHAVRPVPLAAEPPAQKRRLAQFGQGRTGISGARARTEVPQRRRPNLPLGNSRPGSISGAVDRYLLAAGLLSARQAAFQTRQRGEIDRRRTAAAVGRHVLVRRIPDPRHVGRSAERHIGLPAAARNSGLRACRTVAFGRRTGQRRVSQAEAQRLSEAAARSPGLFRSGRGRTVRSSGREAPVCRLYGTRLRQLPGNGGQGLVGPAGAATAARRLRDRRAVFR